MIAYFANKRKVRFLIMKKNNKKRINDNICKADCFEMKLSYFTDSSIFALNSVERRYLYDESRKKTDVVDAIAYIVTDDRLNRYKIKVQSTVPVIEQQELEEAEEILYIEFPTDECVVKPYKIEFGRTYVSITAPYAKLVNSDEIDLENERSV